MIGSFKHHGLKRLYQQEDSRLLPRDMVNRIRAILVRLSIADKIGDMDIHEYRLHELKGAWKGSWSVVVRANWRITFRFESGHALDVNFEDYH